MSQVTTRRIEANGLSFVADEAGRGDKVALCLHGFPESRFSWRHQLPLLETLGWRAIAPDLRGYGETSRPPRTADYNIDRLVDDIEALFDASGAKRRLLIGHDWGAIIAWAFAIERRLPLDGLVIMNVPHPAIFGQVLRKSAAQRRRSWYVAFFQLPILPEWSLTARGARAIGAVFTNMAVDKSRFPPEIVDVYRQNALKPGAARAMVNYYRASPDLLKRFGTASPMIEIPTLMVWGEADAALGLECTEGYQPYVRDLTLERLPGVSHWVQQEAPETVNRIMNAWMRDKGLA